jgi:flagellar hook-length control protein FliK
MDSNDRGKLHKHDGNHVTSASSTPAAAKNDSAKTNTDTDTAVNGATDTAKANVEDDGSLPKTSADAESATDPSATNKTATTDAISALKTADGGKANAGKADTNSQLQRNGKAQPASGTVEAVAVPQTGKNAAAAGKPQPAATAKAKVQAPTDTVKVSQPDSETASSTNSAAQAAPTETQTTTGAKQVTRQVSDKPTSKFDEGKTAGGNNQSVKSADQGDPSLNNNANTSAVADVVVPTIVVNGNDATKTKGTGDDAIHSITAKGDTSVGPLGHSLRTDLASGSRETEANDTPQVDPSRFVSRVAKAVQTANDRGGPLQLRLSPPELGSLKIQLTLKDGGLSASLEADNSNARKLLLDHLPALRDRLADQNIRVDRFDVDVKQENTGGQANSRGSNQNPYQQQEQQSGARRTPTAGTPAKEIVAPVASSQVPSVTSSGINLVI